MKHCPVCKDSLEQVVMENQSVDVCPGCGGIWFERDELHMVATELLKRGAVAERGLQETLSTQPGPASAHTSRPCPVDGVIMESFNYCYDSNVILDKCRHCQGIWTDRDELREVARYRRGNDQVDRLAEALLESRKQTVRLQKLNREVSEWTEPMPLYRLLLLRFSLFPLPLPVHDTFRQSRLPLVTASLIAANLLAFFYLTGMLPEALREDFIRSTGFVPALGFGAERWPTLLTTLFIHGGLAHLLGNMYFLWIFGENVEEELGRLRYLFFYLACGVAGTLLYFLTASDGELPVVGASGAISGVLGAYLVLLPHAELNVLWLGRLREIRAVHYLGFWMLLQMFLGLVTLAAKDCTISGGVAYWSHIGGFLSGVIFAYLLGLRRFPEGTSH